MRLSDGFPESWVTLYHEVNGRIFDGTPGVRSVTAPCDFFDGKRPDGSGRCEGDGHYLCHECSRLRAEPDDDGGET